MKSLNISKRREARARNSSAARSLHGSKASGLLKWRAHASQVVFLQRGSIQRYFQQSPYFSLMFRDKRDRIIMHGVGARLAKKRPRVGNGSRERLRGGRTNMMGQRPVRTTAVPRKRNRQRIPRSPTGSNMVGGPPSTVQTCSFWKNTLQVSPGTNTAVRFLPNGLYDVDPIVGSTSAIAFNEWAAFYNKYRVLSYKVTWEVVNQDPLAVEVNVCNTNLDPGATNTNYPAYARMAHGKHFVLGNSSSNNRRTVVQTIQVRDIVGTSASFDSLQATVSANPTNVIFCGLGINASPAGVVTTGATVVCTIDMRTLFFERKLLTN